MMSTASSSIAWRTSTRGHGSPRMCSLRFSPDPTPRKNRPGMRHSAVAAACAMIAGWMRTVGHVTAVPSRSVEVARAIPPMTAQTNGAWPCRSIHGR